jgi:hypothetical protein
MLALPDEAGRVLRGLLAQGPDPATTPGAAGAEEVAAFQRGLREVLAGVLQIKVGLGLGSRGVTGLPLAGLGVAVVAGWREARAASIKEMPVLQQPAAQGSLNSTRSARLLPSSFADLQLRSLTTNGSCPHQPCSTRLLHPHSTPCVLPCPFRCC